MALRVHPGLVIGKGLQLLVAQKLHLGDADAVLPRDHTAQAAGQRHDALDGAMRGLQHVVVVAVDRQVGVHIAVASMHVQRSPDPALEHALVHCDALFQDRLKSPPSENLLQRRQQLGFPAGAQRVVLQLGKQRVHLVQPALPQGPHLAQQRQRLRHPVAQQLGRGNLARVILPAQRQAAPGKKFGQGVAQGQFVAQAELDVDALDAVGVLGHARQRDHHVFIDLEGVGVARDGGGALAVKPKFLACLGANGHKTLAAARVGNAHHLRGGTRHGISIVTGNVAHQHHLGQAAAFGLGGITHRLEVTVVQVLQPGQQHARALLLGKHVVLDLDNAGHGVSGIAKKLQADGAGVARHAVHDPARAGDEAVATLFLDAGQAA